MPLKHYHLIRTVELQELQKLGDKTDEVLVDIREINLERRQLSNKNTS
jgi:hypothetical protein